ncbi:NTP transferase domain-containing protein [Sphingomonas quercus]|uniref:Phosphocholine cytidylyltransferase family protein n=1 Tax=Sphingomonas quercus TaxID=2842451 RepID=A0ABS6BKJ2_9SPHN|nr:phosphocholine cytidylyltransferase family protein [Sphingomonas quercus]MBU3078811.1 phosphocholine cytidylyltransferase family protein [Sphingomonas quercus]
MMIRRAIVLSAGKGSRLLPLTEDRPKCLIELSGRTLLEWQLDALDAAGIEEVTVVSGFRADLVDAVVAPRAGASTLFNPFYHVADNLGSVWMARDLFDRDTLLLNGDTLVPYELVQRVITAAAAAPITVTVDEKPAYDDDDMKVRREGDRLRRIGKTLSAQETNAESIGLLAFRGEGRDAFISAVDRIMHTPLGTASWYLKVIDMLADESEIGTVSVNGFDWCEVDFPADLDVARALTAVWRDEGR